MTLERHKTMQILLILTLFAASAARAQQLDPTFGANGIKVTRIDANIAVTSAALQTDGKIVVAGYSCVKAGVPCYIMLARYKKNGALDERFGNDGIVRTRSPRATGSIVIEKDGKIVLGAIYCQSHVCQAALFRYTSNGSWDRTFGQLGVAIIPSHSTVPLSFRTYISSIVVQPDQKIVAAGTWGSPVQFAIARFNPDGSLDSRFGRKGEVRTTIASNDGQHSVFVPRLALQNDGGIIAAGGNGDLQYPDRFTFVVTRYHPNGHLNRNFGKYGIVRTRFRKSPLDFASSVLVQNGKIVATGVSNSDLVMSRYNRPGTLDTTFGHGGKLFTGLGANTIGDPVDFQDVYNPAVMNGTKIISVGYVCQNNTDYGENNPCVALLRLNPDGTRDSSFGNKGLFWIKELKGSDVITNLFVTTDRKLIVTGTACHTFGSSIRCKVMIARLNLD